MTDYTVRDKKNYGDTDVAKVAYPKSLEKLSICQDMVALGLCWKSGIAAEVIGTPSGSIGEHLQQAKIYLDMPDLFAWTLVIVLVSLAFERTVLALLSWTAKRLERM